MEMYNRDQELIKAYQDYVVFLTKEIASMSGVCLAQGWQSKFDQEGINCRKRIRELLNTKN